MEERELRRFLQFVAFNPPTYPMADTSDEDGDELWGMSETYELMSSANVRVLVDPTTDAETAVRMLRKIADWIEQESDKFDFIARSGEAGDRHLRALLHGEA